jgi:hypothetical protein
MGCSGATIKFAGPPVTPGGFCRAIDPVAAKLNFAPESSYDATGTG